MHRLLTSLFLALTLALPVRAADRPAGLLGKVAMTLAARALAERNPAQMADVAALLEADLLEKTGQRAGVPWDLATLKRELALTAMEAAPEARDAAARLMGQPIMTSLFPVFAGEVPVGSVQIGRVGTALAVFALRAPEPALKDAVGRVLAAHALERATADHAALWDLRELKQTLAMWAMSPDAEAVRGDLSAVLGHAQAMASLFRVFEAH